MFSNRETEERRAGFMSVTYILKTLKMAGSELEHQLMDAANRIVLPSTQPALMNFSLFLIGQGNLYLRCMEQSSRYIMTVLLHMKNALVCDKLSRHSNMEVKVLGANCVMELMTITASHAPYDDERLKEVFYLIVAAFD